MGRDKSEARQFYRVIKETIFKPIDESRGREQGTFGGHGSDGRGCFIIHNSNSTNDIPLSNSPHSTGRG